LAILSKETTVEHNDNKGRGDAEEESAEVQARVDGVYITDGGGPKDGISQDGEREPSDADNFSVERVPAPTGKIHDQESGHGRAQGDDGGCGDGVSARKAHIGMEEKV
jgi:hypothetical protein